MGIRSGVGTSIDMAPPWPGQGGHFYRVKTGHFYFRSTRSCARSDMGGQARGHGSLGTLGGADIPVGPAAARADRNVCPTGLAKQPRPPASLLAGVRPEAVSG